jgi:Phosphotransferase enzyme family
MKASFMSSTMNDRRVLGGADVTDDDLSGLVAELWGEDAVTLVDSVAERVPYDVPSILTASRTSVRGHAHGADGLREFAFFVKVVQHWRHSPAFAFVPPEIADWAATTLPWRAEPLVYRSDLSERLPDGFTMPRAVRVTERDDETAVLWLEAVDHDDVAWTAADHARAARVLGRLSASPRVAPLADVDPQPWHIDMFVAGRIGHTVLPGLHEAATWQHPAVAEHFGDLREPLTGVAQRLDDLAAEYAGLRHLASHGDACPNNLLRRHGDPGFTLIDFGFWRSQPVAFDLAQLLVGDIQVGRQDAEDLPERGRACLEAYAAGLADEGLDVSLDEVARGHAVSLMLFNGLPSLPVELVAQQRELEAAGGVTDDHRRASDHWVAQRAGIARYALDLLDRTGG